MMKKHILWFVAVAAILLLLNVNEKKTSLIDQYYDDFETGINPAKWVVSNPSYIQQPSGRVLFDSASACAPATIPTAAGILSSTRSFTSDDVAIAYSYDYTAGGGDCECSPIATPTILLNGISLPIGLHEATDAGSTCSGSPTQRHYKTGLIEVVTFDDLNLTKFKVRVDGELLPTVYNRDGVNNLTMYGRGLSVTEVRYSPYFSCAIDYNIEVVVKKTFNEGSYVNWNALNPYTPVKFCPQDLPLLIISGDGLTASRGTITEQIARGDTLQVPAGQYWEMYYIAYYVNGMTEQCGIGQAYNTNTQMCDQIAHQAVPPTMLYCEQSSDCFLPQQCNDAVVDCVNNQCSYQSAVCTPEEIIQYVVLQCDTDSDCFMPPQCQDGSVQCIEHTCTYSSEMCPPDVVYVYVTDYNILQCSAQSDCIIPPQCTDAIVSCEDSYCHYNSTMCTQPQIINYLLTQQMSQVPEPHVIYVGEGQREVSFTASPGRRLAETIWQMEAMNVLRDDCPVDNGNYIDGVGCYEATVSWGSHQNMHIRNGMYTQIDPHLAVRLDLSDALAYRGTRDGVYYDYQFIPGHIPTYHFTVRFTDVFDIEVLNYDERLDLNETATVPLRITNNLMNLYDSGYKIQVTKHMRDIFEPTETITTPFTLGAHDYNLQLPTDEIGAYTVEVTPYFTMMPGSEYVGNEKVVFGYFVSPPNSFLDCHDIPCSIGECQEDGNCRVEIDCHESNCPSGYLCESSGTCLKTTVVNNTLYETVYYNTTNNRTQYVNCTTLGCPTGYTCQAASGVCTATTGMDNTFLLLAGGIIVVFVIMSKKKKGK